MAEKPNAPELTKPADFIVPYQDKIEQVIDARLAAHAAQEKAEKKPSTSSRSTASDSKSEGGKEDPKS